MALPDQKWIGVVLIVLGCLIFIFDVKIEHGRICFGNPTGRHVSYWGPWILIFGGPLIGLLWLFWTSSATTQPPQKVISKPTASDISGPTLTPSQEQLLSLIAKYQRIFTATKLIIGRDGSLYFDGEPAKGRDVNFVTELFGSPEPSAQKNFVDLMESIPQEYIRFFPEMRWNSPFVVAVTERGMKYLRNDNSSNEVAGKPELGHRSDLLARLRQEFILSHDNISPAMAAGLENPPTDWINQRLEQLGETWRVPPANEKTK
jgi:hypothetical protein